jgi:hypothetical protein
LADEGREPVPDAIPAAASWAAAAAEAFATTRIVGSPSEQAAAATSVRARA